MAKCPICGGTGISPVNKKARCSFCFGTGKTDRKVVLTNEEWLRQANTEQLAEVLNKMTLSCYICGQDGVREDARHCVFGKCTGKEDIEEWLKQPHKE